MAVNFPTGGRILCLVTTWTARQVAAEAGISETSGRDLVRSLGLAPVDRDMETGAKLYDAAQARAALASRPGRGRRTDLGKLGRPFTQDEQGMVRSWNGIARRMRKTAWELDDDTRSTLLLASGGMEKLVEAARKYPLFAMHPDWSNDHKRVYNIATELGRQLVPLAIQASRHGAEKPLLVEELDAVQHRFWQLVGLALSGSPMPPRLGPAHSD